MGLIPRFNNMDVLMELQKGYRTIENGIIKVFQFVGEEFVTDARNMTKPEGGFGDVTGNLRSSIGYFILKDGVVINENLQGTAEGISSAKEILGSIPKGSGYQLIGVAGMEYASAVESRGLNVITSQSDTALISLERMLKGLHDRLNKKGVAVDFDLDDVIRTVLRS